MENVNKLISLLGEDNEKRLKDSITNIIIDVVKDDIGSYDRQNYILEVEDVIEFVDECKKEAFDRVREEVIQNMMDKIRLTMDGE